MTTWRTCAGRITVIGVGNLLLQDEGLGIHAVWMLQAQGFPPEVQIIDGGTAGLDLLLYFQDAELVILIDCLDAGAPPGTIFRLPATELDLSSNKEAISVHDIQIKDVLALANMLGRLPPTLVYGVQPASIAWGTGLSPQVAAALSRLADLVRNDVFIWLREGKLYDRLPTAEGKGGEPVPPVN